MITHHIAVTRLEIVSWTTNSPTSPRPNLRVAIAALGRCNCFAELHGLAGCLISTPSTASHVMSGTLRRAAPSSSQNCMPELRQPEADHPGYLIKQGSSTGHGWSYTMSPTIAECLRSTVRKRLWLLGAGDRGHRPDSIRTREERDRRL